MRWLFHRASEYGVVPPTLNIVACPLIEGDWTPWVIEKEIPLHGDGEQSTKFGGPWPYWLQPPLCCKFENEFPPLPVLGGVGAGEVGGGVPVVVASATAICSDCSLEFPLESETETPKLKFPLAVGVPEIAPVLSASATPCGSWPETTAKL